MSDKLISIIIPVYNRESYLDKCIGSAIGQKNVNTEIIIVDDGSTDASAQICDDYAKSNDNVFVIHTSNLGAGHARNTGLDHAKGDYIFFLDSDDFLAPDALSGLLQNLEKSGADYCIGGISECDDDGTLIRDIRYPEECRNKSVDTDTAFRCSFSLNFPLMDLITARLYHKRIWENLRFTIGKVAEDTLIVPELARRTCSIFFMDEPVYSLCLSSNSIMRTKTLKKYIDFCESSRILVDFYIEKGFYDAAMYRFNEGTRNLLAARKYRDPSKNEAIKNNYLGFCGLVPKLMPHATPRNRFQLKLFTKCLPVYAAIQGIYSDIVN